MFLFPVRCAILSLNRGLAQCYAWGNHALALDRARLKEESLSSGRSWKGKLTHDTLLCSSCCFFYVCCAGEASGTCFRNRKKFFFGYPLFSRLCQSITILFPSPPFSSFFLFSFFFFGVFLQNSQYLLSLNAVVPQRQIVRCGQSKATRRNDRSSAFLPRPIKARQHTTRRE